MIILGNAYRLDRIYSYLLRNGSATVDELAELFHVTPTTIRRDLLVLEEKMLIHRSRGMAYVTDSDNRDTSVIFGEEKKRIAIAASKLITNKMSLALDSGSTVEALCSQLIENEKFSDLNIVTHSLKVALLASSGKNFNVSLPGGAYVPGFDSLGGITVEEFYQNINADISILSSNGVYNCAGLTVSYPIQLQLKRLSARCGSRRVALLDSSKYMSRGIYVFCDFHDIDTLITVQTDENEAELERIAKTGVNIILA